RRRIIIQRINKKLPKIKILNNHLKIRRKKKNIIKSIKKRSRGSTNHLDTKRNKISKSTISHLGTKRNKTSKSIISHPSTKRNKKSKSIISHPGNKNITNISIINHQDNRRNILHRDTLKGSCKKTRNIPTLVHSLFFYD